MAKYRYEPTEYADPLGVYNNKTVKRIVDRFVKQLQDRKINVSSDALTHNFVCWVHGCSSGVIDYVNCVFVETKRSWKCLRFEITKLADAKNPRTYIE